MKVKTSVAVDPDLKEQIQKLGMSVSSITERAMETVLSESCEDYRLQFKIKLYEDTINDILYEQDFCKKRYEVLDEQLALTRELLKEAKDNYVLATTVVKLSKLTQKINRVIIMNNYDADIVVDKAHDLLVEMKQMNSDFNLTQHIISLRKMLND